MTAYIYVFQLPANSFSQTFNYFQTHTNKTALAKIALGVGLLYITSVKKKNYHLGTILEKL
jgi:hypothetical protein